MVPKDEGQPSDRGGSRARKSKAKAKGSAKGKRRRVKGKQSEPAFIDPDYAVLVKYKERGQIVAIGHQREISPSEFSRETGIDLRIVSGHFRALRNADFLELVGEVQVRGATKHMYRSTKRAFFSAVDWGKLGEAVQEQLAPGVMQDINTAFNDAMETGTFHKHDDVVLFWLSVMLDKISWPDLIEILAWAIEEAERLSCETVNRHANGESDGTFPAAFAVMAFESPTESERKKARRRRKPKAAKQKPAKRKAAKARAKGKARSSETAAARSHRA